jgi:peptidyl-tRNA hydrolase
MAKAVVAIGYNKYVVDVGDAVTLLTILTKAEKYEEKWSQAGTTKHVYEMGEESVMFINVLPDAAYTTYKLAGKPKE